MVRHLLHTFDYELFLGPRSGAPADCVLKPTELIVAALEPHGQKGIFFVDTAWLLRLREVAARFDAARRDFEAVMGQLRHLHQRGHYVFPHLHPHWVDAVYLSEQNEWDLSNLSAYTMQQCGEAEGTRLLDESIALLREGLGENWMPTGYRAGGWSIQPFSLFEPSFVKHGILCDFSLLPGFWTDYGPQAFDFTPSRAQQPYRFHHDLLVEKADGPFTEFPISVIEGQAEDFIQKTWRRIIYRTGSGRSFGRGIGVLGWPNPTYPLAPSLNETHEMVAIELFTLPKIPRYLRFLHGHSFMHFISHPKMISPHNAHTLRRFLKRASRRYTLESDFLKMIPLLSGK